jgi:hypothetical protein
MSERNAWLIVVWLSVVTVALYVIDWRFVTFESRLSKIEQGMKK